MENSESYPQNSVTKERKHKVKLGNKFKLHNIWKKLIDTNLIEFFFFFNSYLRQFKVESDFENASYKESKFTALHKAHHSFPT